jgi:uncharacterized membrane protein YczE
MANMKSFLARLVSMVFGLMLYALGIVVTIKANIGYAPWDVLHVGISKTIGLSIGTVSILTGFFLLIIVALLGEKLGLGTIANMVLIGLFIDMFLFIDVIPTGTTMVVGIPMLIAGLFIIAFGSFFYIRSAFGAGPRDSLMVALTRKTKIPVGICRCIIEFFATLGGWFLGGMVGIGTIISVIAIGFCIQITFKLTRFNVTAVQHESLRDTFRAFTSSSS